MAARFLVLWGTRCAGLDRQLLAGTLVGIQVFVTLALVLLWASAMTLFFRSLMGMDEGMLQLYIILLGAVAAVIVCNPFFLGWLMNWHWGDSDQVKFVKMPFILSYIYRYICRHTYIST